MRPTPFSFASASSPFSSVHRAPLSISPFQSSRAAVRANHPRDFTFRRPRRWFTFDRRASIATPPNYPLGESLNNRGNVSSTNMARHEACKIAEREREREREDVTDFRRSQLPLSSKIGWLVGSVMSANLQSIRLARRRETVPPCDARRPCSKSPDRVAPSLLFWFLFVSSSFLFSSFLSSRRGRF